VQLRAGIDLYFYKDVTAVSVYFTKTASNAWTWNALGTASEITTPAVATAGDVNTLVGTGTMTFDTDGSLLTNSSTALLRSRSSAPTRPRRESR